VGMQGELSWWNVLFYTALLDQSLGQFRAFLHRHHPASDVPAEDIEDHVEVEVRPLGRSEQFGDVPAPKLIGSRGHQFWLLVERMSELIAALARFAASFEEAMYAADRAKILPFIEQRRINSSWGAILEAFFMEASQDGFPFRWTKCPRRGRPRRGHRRSRSLTAIPVVRGTRHMERPARCAGAHVHRQLGDCGHQDFSTGSGSRIG